MFLRCCLWSLNSQLWEILDADGSNWLIFCCFCCLYKTEEDGVFTEGITSLAVMSSVAGWTWGSEHRQPQDWGKICNFISSSHLSFCLLLCTPIPALLAFLLQIKTQWKAPSQCCYLCCIPDAEGRSDRHHRQRCCIRASIILKACVISQHWGAVVERRGQFYNSCLTAHQ